MASYKAKRLGRFLERIGIKNKQDKKSVDLSGSSRSWIRFLPGRSESSTCQSKTTDDSTRFSMLFRILKIRKDSRSRQSDAQADDHDVAEDLAEYSGVDNNNITLSSNIAAGNGDEGSPSTIYSEVSDQQPIIDTSFGDLTVVTEQSSYSWSEREKDVSSELSMSSITPLEEFTEDVDRKDRSEDIYQSTASVWIQPQCDHKEVDEHEGAQSNAVDDTIIILMPLITTVTLIVCLLLLHFLTGH